MIDATSQEWTALGMWVLIAFQSWISWGLLQNGRVVFDTQRGLALCVGVMTTIAAWFEFILMREHNLAPPPPSS